MRTEWSGGVAWSVVIVPIVLFGSVLYPAGRKAPRLSEPIPEDLKYILSVDPKELTSVQEISSAALRSNSLDELFYEILRLAHLRERKRKRFLLALFGAAFCFVFFLRLNFASFS